MAVSDDIKAALRGELHQKLYNWNILSQQPNGQAIDLSSILMPTKPEAESQPAPEETVKREYVETVAKSVLSADRERSPGIFLFDKNTWKIQDLAKDQEIEPTWEDKYALDVFYASAPMLAKAYLEVVDKLRYVEHMRKADLKEAHEFKEKARSRNMRLEALIKALGGSVPPVGE